MSVVIRVKNNGSLKVEGDFKIVDMDGNEFDLGGRTAVSLCRCGHSATMPFCDKAHRVAGFESVCHAFALGPLKEKNIDIAPPMP
jgi:CDGSH-type Zn-finger protein